MQGLRHWIRSRLARRLHVPEIPVALHHLARQGFSPDLVFDVGAYRGEFAGTCLALWPRARIACFEPQADCRADLDALARAQPGVRVFPMLLGAEPCERVALREAQTASSVLAEIAGPAHPQAWYPMGTVDRTVDEACEGLAPALLKIDVQGYELEVLKGAEASLARIELVLAELNLLDLHRDVPLIGEVIAWLGARNFVAFDVCGLARRPLDGALWQVDMMFVPESSALRADKRWQV